MKRFINICVVVFALVIGGCADYWDADVPVGGNNDDMNNVNNDANNSNNDVNNDVNNSNNTNDPTPVASCGNGIQETGEECDGSHVIDVGQLISCGDGEKWIFSCSDDCKIDQDCEEIPDPVEDDPICGDGELEGDEDCEAGQFSRSCGTGYSQHCRDNCTMQCIPLCGNGNIDAGEECDGSNFASSCPSGYNCSCNSSCRVVAELACGNGVIEASMGESCDSGNYASSCPVGTVRSCTGCQMQCTAPVGVCGDGQVNGTEQCEPGIAIGSTCQARGYDSGSLTCVNCMISEANCEYDSVLTAYCGDGIRQSSNGESCDINDLAGQSCTSMGYDGGTLSCSSSCSFNTSSCYYNSDPEPETSICDLYDRSQWACVSPADGIELRVATHFCGDTMLNYATIYAGQTVCGPELMFLAVEIASNQQNWDLQWNPSSLPQCSNYQCSVDLACWNVQWGFVNLTVPSSTASLMGYRIVTKDGIPHRFVYIDDAQLQTAGESLTDDVDMTCGPALTF